MKGPIMPIEIVQGLGWLIIIMTPNRGPQRGIADCGQAAGPVCGVFVVGLPAQTVQCTTRLLQSRHARLQTSERYPKLIAGGLWVDA